MKHLLLPQTMTMIQDQYLLNPQAHPIPPKLLYQQQATEIYRPYPPRQVPQPKATTAILLRI